MCPNGKIFTFLSIVTSSMVYPSDAFCASAAAAAVDGEFVLPLRSERNEMKVTAIVSAAAAAASAAVYISMADKTTCKTILKGSDAEVDWARLLTRSRYYMYLMCGGGFTTRTCCVGTIVLMLLHDPFFLVSNVAHDRSENSLK